MEIFNVNNFTKGWFIGDFSPTLLKTNNFEIAIKHYSSGDKESAHYHAIALEYTIAIAGVFMINDVKFQKDEIIVLSPGEISVFECIEDGTTVVIKMPSIKNDKYII